VALFLSFLVAMFVTMMLIPPLIRGAERLQFVDLPGERKVHTQAIPRIGGIAMVIGAVLPIIFWLGPQPQVIGLLAGFAVIVVFGVWDDRSDLDYRIKFLGQFIAAVIVVVYGGVRVETIPMLDFPLADVVSIPVTIFVLLAITNAINLADGLDGLAGGTTLLSLGMIAVLAYINSAVVIVLIALAVIGSILGFLRFNTHPARIFMGDGGSQFLGFSLGALALMLTQGITTPYSAALPVLLLGLPILDTAMVMAQRIYAGRSPFSADRNHIHHRLLGLGLDHYEAVFAIYVVQAALVVAAYFLRHDADAVVLSAYAGLCIVIIALFHWAHVTSFYLRREPARVSYVSAKMKFLRHEGGLARWAATAAGVAIPGCLLLSAASTELVTVDFGILAFLLLGVLLLSRMRTDAEPFSWIERIAFYAISAFIVYLMQVGPGALEDYGIAQRVFYVLLAVVVIIGFRFSREKAFRLTTLDFLVIFAAFAIPNLPGLPFTAPTVGEGIAKVIVLFYGVELILTNLPRGHAGVRYAMYAVLAVLGVRGVF
jgi:UDP-GlcNAc:undecaprenyl-phosphate GlcNAc-1-phosphate transferase